MKTQTLARATRQSPEQLEHALRTLDKRGWEVITDEAGRVTLGTGGPLCAEEIERTLRGQVVGRQVKALEEVTSTQEAAREAARGTEGSGTVIFAERQTLGRGRFGRKWESRPRKDLMFTTVVRFANTQMNPSLVTVAAAVAVCETLFEDMGLPAQIRWPNDVLLAGRKVAGILVEKTQGRTPAYLVGIGLNVNGGPGTKDAISLAQFMGKEVDRTEVACEVLRRLENCYRMIETGETQEIALGWRRHSNTLGRRVTLMSRGKAFTGRVLDIDVETGLSVQTDRGSILTFRPEDTTLHNNAK